MAHPQRGHSGASFSQSDPPHIAPHFPQNHLGLNEGELILPLTRLQLHRSSQAGNEVNFSDLSIYSATFSIYLELITLHEIKSK